jgi:hypothetical protein
MDKNNKNGRPGNLLIFILPACGFVVARNLTWLDDVNAGVDFIQPFAEKPGSVKTNVVDANRS